MVAFLNNLRSYVHRSPSSQKTVTHRPIEVFIEAFQNNCQFSNVYRSFTNFTKIYVFDNNISNPSLMKNY